MFECHCGLGQSIHCLASCRSLRRKSKLIDFLGAGGLFIMSLNASHYCCNLFRLYHFFLLRIHYGRLRAAIKVDVFIGQRSP